MTDPLRPGGSGPGRQPKPYRVAHGGLMRCCLLSLDNAMVKHHAQMTTPQEGDIVRCEWCDDPDGMVLRDGIWRWNHA